MLINPAKTVEIAVAETNEITYEHGFIWYRGVQVNNYCVDKILALKRDGANVSMFEKFLVNLYANPNKEVIPYLYEFLEYGGQPITQNGTFLALKRVRSDYRDIHSGRFDNSPGQTVTEDRSVVNSDRNTTCARGLHFCSWEYLSHFGSSERDSDRVVIVEINPADVVMIPSDYNNTKARCCKYKVLYDIGKPWGQIKQEELKQVLNKSNVVVENDSKPDVPYVEEDESITNTILELVIEYGGDWLANSSTVVTHESKLGSVGFDSLDMIELIMMLEDEFACEFDDAVLETFMSEDLTILGLARELLEHFPDDLMCYASDSEKDFYHNDIPPGGVKASLRRKIQVPVSTPVKTVAKTLPARDAQGRFISNKTVAVAQTAAPTLGQIKNVQIGSTISKQYWNGNHWRVLHEGERMRNIVGQFIPGQVLDTTTGYFRKK
jgi:acyl carrier protein